MKVAFVSGLVVAVLGLLVSLLARNWQPAFVLSASARAIGIIISGFIKNYTLIMRAALKIKDEDGIPLEDQYWIKLFSTFAMPNIILAVILYFIIYRMH